MTAVPLGTTGRSRASASAASSARAAARAGVLHGPLTSYRLVVLASSLLGGLGLVMVFSASSVTSYAADGSSYALLSKQLLFFFIGLPLALVASRLSPRVYRWVSYPLLVASLGLLVLVLVPGVGSHVSGAVRWIDVGPFQLQPSEPAKLSLALWGADLLVRKQRLLGEWRHMLVPLVPVALLFAGLVMLEPDLGTTISMTLVVLALLFVAGAPLRMFSILVGAMVVVASLLAVLSPYRLQRLTSFTDPFKDAQVTGYQAVHGYYALASGGWWGKGLGAGLEKWAYLPNAHTDYIFAVIGEELGLVGTLVVLALFALLGYAGFRIASRNRDPFVRLAAAAVTVWLVGQALINMGYVVGLLPVTGIPLPLISYGGTSLILTMASVGMLASFARREPGVAEVLAARGPGRLQRSGERLAFWRRPEPRPAARRSGATPSAPPRRRRPRRSTRRTRPVRGARRA